MYSLQVHNIYNDICQSVFSNKEDNVVWTIKAMICLLPLVVTSNVLLQEGFDIEQFRVFCWYYTCIDLKHKPITKRMAHQKRLQHLLVSPCVNRTIQRAPWSHCIWAAFIRFRRTTSGTYSSWCCSSDIEKRREVAEYARSSERFGTCCALLGEFKTTRSIVYTNSYALWNLFPKLVSNCSEIVVAKNISTVKNGPDIVRPCHQCIATATDFETFDRRDMRNILQTRHAHLVVSTWHKEIERFENANNVSQVRLKKKPFEGMLKD